MTASELEESLATLGLVPNEAAELLGVSDRTIRRWLEGEQTPGPAAAAIRAWRRLQDRHLAWRPDSLTLEEHNDSSIASHRSHAVGLSEILQRVETRGGPRSRWSVSIPNAIAKSGGLEISFYKLLNGGFSCSVYRHRDLPPDIERDREEIEDATFCIAREFGRAEQRASSLRGVAHAVKGHSHVFGTRGSELLGIAARRERKAVIEDLADEIALLADRASDGHHTSYDEFDTIRRKLTDAGYCPPDISLISAVAASYVESDARVRILFVRTGIQPQPVTRILESDGQQVHLIIKGHSLKYIGNRLRPIGETSAPHIVDGPEFVVLDIPKGVAVAGADRPGLFLVCDLRPAQLLERQANLRQNYRSIHS
jgi:hypothetical protein